MRTNKYILIIVMMFFVNACFEFPGSKIIPLEFNASIDSNDKYDTIIRSITNNTDSTIYIYISHVFKDRTTNTENDVIYAMLTSNLIVVQIKDSVFVDYNHNIEYSSHMFEGDIYELAPQKKTNISSVYLDGKIKNFLNVNINSYRIRFVIEPIIHIDTTFSMRMSRRFNTKPLYSKSLYSNWIDISK